MTCYCGRGSDRASVRCPQAPTSRQAGTPARLQDVSSDEDIPAATPAAALSATPPQAPADLGTQAAFPDQGSTCDLADAQSGEGGGLATWIPADLGEAVRRVAEYGSRAVAAAVDGTDPGSGAGLVPSPPRATVPPGPVSHSAGLPGLAGSASMSEGLGTSLKSDHRQQSLDRLALTAGPGAASLATASSESLLRRFAEHQQPAAASSPASPAVSAAASGARGVSAGSMASDPVLAMPPARTYSRPMTVLEAAQRRAVAVRIDLPCRNT